jgi:hypothetical protein
LKLATIFAYDNPDGFAATSICEISFL